MPVGKTPVCFRHLGGIRREKQNIVASVRAATIEPTVPLKLWKLLTQLREAANERGDVLALIAQPRPVDPADLVVLAIGVVVAGLAVAHLIAGKDHGNALRQQQA